MADHKLIHTETALMKVTDQNRPWLIAEAKKELDRLMNEKGIGFFEVTTQKQVQIQKAGELVNKAMDEKGLGFYTSAIMQQVTA